MPAVGADEGLEGDSADEVPEYEPEFGYEVGPKPEDLVEKGFQKTLLGQISVYPKALIPGIWLNLVENWPFWPCKRLFMP
jgi:hypothetical protein